MSDVIRTSVDSNLRRREIEEVEERLAGFLEGFKRGTYTAIVVVAVPFAENGADVKTNVFAREDDEPSPTSAAHLRWAKTGLTKAIDCVELIEDEIEKRPQRLVGRGP